MANLPPWSFTMLSDASNCMKKAYHKYIAKDLPKEEKSREQLHGIAVHEAFERAINKGGWNEISTRYKALADPFIALKATAEHKFGMSEDRKGEPFFGKPWGRGVCDVLVMPREDTAILADWKTGKVREDPRELACQALLLKANYPKITRIVGAYVWLKEDRLGEQYDLSNTDRAYYGTQATLKEMRTCLDEDDWPASPNPLCGWCPVKSCAHNKS